jgi:hypothetical protein
MNDRAVGVIFLLAALVAKIAFIWLLIINNGLYLFQGRIERLTPWINGFAVLGAVYLVWAEGVRFWHYRQLRQTTPLSQGNTSLNITRLHPLIQLLILLLVVMAGLAFLFSLAGI